MVAVADAVPSATSSRRKQVSQISYAAAVHSLSSNGSDSLRVSHQLAKHAIARDAPVPTTARSVKEGHIIERFSRYSDDEIFYQFTVEDSNIYSQPWTAELSFYATDDRLYEYACHEGNYSMPGILAGARRLEMEEAAQ